MTVPVLRSSGPGEPIPTPATAPRVVPCAAVTSPIASSTMWTMRSTTALGPRCASVGNVRKPSTSPPAIGTSPTTILVPPRSTPTIHFFSAVPGVMGALLSWAAAVAAGLGDAAT
jgi:hypothetical protein